MGGQATLDGFMEGDARGSAAPNSAGSAAAADGQQAGTGGGGGRSSEDKGGDDGSSAAATQQSAPKEKEPRLYWGFPRDGLVVPRALVGNGGVGKAMMPAKGRNETDDQLYERLAKTARYWRPSRATSAVRWMGCGCIVAACRARSKRVDHPTL